VHRDIKPGNLFLSDDGTVRILDLGLAQDFDSEENLTRDFNERVLGTADYLAPEQAADSHAADARADLYSLGCSLFFLLTGQAPFTEGTLIQRLLAHQRNAPPPISRFRSDVPDELISILTGMMMKDRNQRISSAAEVADRLSQFLANSANRSGPDQQPEGVQSQPDPTDAAADESPQERFLPEFSDLLRRIEAECGSSGALSADPRSPDLLTLVRSLSVQTVHNSPSQPVPVRERPGTAVPTNWPQKIGRSLMWILALSCVATLIYMAWQFQFSVDAWDPFDAWAR
jgi:serine/threonine-protein kinase